MTIERRLLPCAATMTFFPFFKSAAMILSKYGKVRGRRVFQAFTDAFGIEIRFVGRRRNIIAAAPNMDLFVAVFFSRVSALLSPCKRVMTLIQRRIADNRYSDFPDVCNARSKVLIARFRTEV